jgi:hypothetical protein
VRNRYNTTNDKVGTVFGCGCIVMLIAALVLVSWFVTGPFQCNNRWPDRPHEYRVMAGCMVQSDDGTWVPEDRYRVLQ